MPRLVCMRKVQLGIVFEPGEIIEVGEGKALRIRRRYRKNFLPADANAIGQSKRDAMILAKQAEAHGAKAQTDAALKILHDAEERSEAEIGAAEAAVAEAKEREKQITVPKAPKKPDVENRATAPKDVS